MGSIKSIAGGLYMGLILIAITTASALSAPILVPTSLNPGDQYRLAFISSGTIDATSSDIGVYNTFVDNLGLAATGISGWTAIASTSTVDARDNTGTVSPEFGGVVGFPIFLLDGSRLVSHYISLWDRSIDRPLNVTEHGDARPEVTNPLNPPLTPSTAVWTGTHPRTGTELSNSAGLGTGIPSFGDFTVSGQGWSLGSTINPDTLLPLYAISGVLTAPSVVPLPAPTPLSLLAICLVGLMIVRSKQVGKDCHRK